MISIKKASALAFACYVGIATAQGSAKLAAPPSSDETMLFLLSQIELDETVSKVTRIGPTAVRIERVRYLNGPKDQEFVEFDFADFDEVGTMSTDARLSCATKGCVKSGLISKSELITQQNTVLLRSDSSDRAARMLKAASNIRKLRGKKAPF